MTRQRTGRVPPELPCMLRAELSWAELLLWKWNSESRVNDWKALLNCQLAHLISVRKIKVYVKCSEQSVKGTSTSCHIDKKTRWTDSCLSTCPVCHTPLNVQPIFKSKSLHKLLNDKSTQRRATSRHSRNKSKHMDHQTRACVGNSRVQQPSPPKPHYDALTRTLTIERMG